MKKLLAIISVILFADQASALDFDEWVGFECFQYDFRKGKLNTDVIDQEFFAVKKDNTEIYSPLGSKDVPFNKCKNSDFSLECENAEGAGISVHRFTNEVLYSTKESRNFYLFKCNLVERKF